MRATNFTDIPIRMNEIWPWIIAIDAFDYCDPKPLAKLIRETNEIPKELRSVIADVITNKRKPNKRAAAKLKIQPSERMKIAGSISVVLGLIDVSKYDAFFEGDVDADTKPGAASVAEFKGKEVQDVMRELENVAKQIIQEAANDIGVSVEAIEDLLRDLRNKIRKFPEII